MTRRIFLACPDAPIPHHVDLCDCDFCGHLFVEGEGPDDAIQDVYETMREDECSCGKLLGDRTHERWPGYVHE